MTSGTLKPDADAILDVLRRLPKDYRLDPRRAAWASTVYHFTDVRNAAKILASGALLSRAQCHARKQSFHDAADREVIGQSPKAHDYVRLFFRPQTPTQYRMEGIKPAADIEHGAHCPVPVFFLFDAPTLLVRRGVGFSDGGLARQRQAQLGASAEFLENIPFDAVYHDGPFPRDQRDEIVFRRHAEVFVRDRLDLECLREIVCRSPMERITLLSLLMHRVGVEQADAWAERIRLERPDERLYFKRGVYVTGLTLIGNQLSILVNPRRGEYSCRIRLFTLPDATLIVDERRSPVHFDSSLTVQLPRPLERIGVELRIGDALAFRGYTTQRALF